MKGQKQAFQFLIIVFAAMLTSACDDTPVNTPNFEKIDADYNQGWQSSIDKIDDLKGCTFHVIRNYVPDKWDLSMNVVRCPNSLAPTVEHKGKETIETTVTE